jgi:hypothetical protein
MDEAPLAAEPLQYTIGHLFMNAKHVYFIHSYQIDYFCAILRILHAAVNGVDGITEVFQY